MKVGQMGGRSLNQRDRIPGPSHKEVEIIRSNKIINDERTKSFGDEAEGEERHAVNRIEEDTFALF